MLRKQMMQIRSSISEKDRATYNHLIFNHVTRLEYYINTKVIYSYVDFNNEVNTKQIIQYALEDNKQVALPRVEGGDIHFYYVENIGDLQPGAYGILEPTTDKIADEAGLMLIPGLVFDKEKHRIGYGGGYYDKYLCKRNNLFKVALAYECQILADIEYETHDITVDMLISEKGIY